MKIGFIGQGFIGKSYADDFENRGYSVVRYALEEPYVHNKELLAQCEIVFIAVPTPTTPAGFDSSILEKMPALTEKGTVVVIKSTPLPGLTQRIQDLYPDHIILFSPEFLREATAGYDAAHPTRNIIGVTDLRNSAHMSAAEKVLALLPIAPYSNITDALSAEFLKYVSNTLPYVKIVFLNLIHDLVIKKGGNWETLKELLAHDPYIAPHHLDPVHKSGRGAGGHCLIKDFAALRELYAATITDPEGIAFLEAVEAKNKKLLNDSGKDHDLLWGVYGK